MKKTKTTLYIIIITLIILILGGAAYLFITNKKDNTPKVIDTTTDKYVAYIKINPAVKLDYYQVCVTYSDNTKKCDDPIVSNYELVNDDAKNILQNIDLLEKDKDLKSVINLIVDEVAKKGIDVSNIDIQSDWSNLNTYLTTKSETNNQTNNSDNNQNEAITNNITVEIQTKEVVDNNIKTDEENEIKAKEQAAAEAEAKAKAEAEAKAKAEAEAKARAEKTIYLKDNVTYCHTMETYACDNCFTNSFLNELKNARGHYLVSGNSSELTIKVITSLSGSYNNTKYYGTSKISKIRNLAGDNVGGAGGCDEEVTSQICKQFNLICE